MSNLCGECSACCRAFNIPKLNKPAGKWCDHCIIGKSCDIYETRPQVCVEFECFWLQSQKRRPEEQMSLALRPDKCKVILSTSTNERVIAATTMPGDPTAWRRPEVMTVIRNIVRQGYAVVVGGSMSTKRTLFDARGAREVTLSEPDENGVQWGKDE